MTVWGKKPNQSIERMGGAEQMENLLLSWAGEVVGNRRERSFYATASLESLENFPS